MLAAERIERRASLLNAEENLLHAQQQLAAALAASGPGEEETRDKKVATAREKLEAATKALTKPTEGYTPVAKPYPTATTGRRLARTSPQAHHSGSVLRTSRKPLLSCGNTFWLFLRAPPANPLTSYNRVVDSCRTPRGGLDGQKRSRMADATHQARV